MGRKSLRLCRSERVLAKLRAGESLSLSWKNPSSCMKSQVLVPACYLVIDRESKRSVVCHKSCGGSTAAIGGYASTVVSLEGRPAGCPTEL